MKTNKDKKLKNLIMKIKNFLKYKMFLHET